MQLQEFLEEKGRGSSDTEERPREGGAERDVKTLALKTGAMRPQAKER